MRWALRLRTIQKHSFDPSPFSSTKPPTMQTTATPRRTMTRGCGAVILAPAKPSRSPKASNAKANLNRLRLAWTRSASAPKVSSRCRFCHLSSRPHIESRQYDFGAIGRSKTLSSLFMALDSSVTHVLRLGIGVMKESRSKINFHRNWGIRSPSLSRQIPDQNFIQIASLKALSSTASRKPYFVNSDFQRT